MLEKLKNRNVIEYITILGITLLLCQNFLQMHYAPDTYVLYDLGYIEYPSKYFLLDGRLISALVCYIAGIIHLKISTYIVWMDFFAIVFIATAVYIISKVFENIIKPQKEISKFMIIASSFVLILNQFTLEYLLFPESAVMCFGVLLNTIAMQQIIENKKNKYLKIFCLILFAGLCYQGVLNIFPVFAILTYVLKWIKDKRSFKDKEKEFIIEMFKLAVIVAIVLVI